MEIYILVNRLANQQRRAFERLSFLKHCSATQGRVLHYLLNTEKPFLFQKDIESEFGMRAPSVTELLCTMEENGLIRRETSAGDARYKCILPTEKGKAYQKDLQADMETLKNRMTSGISSEELQVWEKVSCQIMDNLERGDKK